jgi:tRNA threonylcarbamoyladenosine biosynthesis protein TsaE
MKTPVKKLFKAKTVEDLGPIAEELIESMKNAKVFAFFGSMGAGKTTFIKVICAKLGIENLVSSPTFSIVNEYETPQGDAVYHFDFYRLNSEKEALDIGYYEYIDSDSLCLMEWPEKIEKLLPDNCVYVNIQAEDDSGVRTLSWEI